MDLYAPRSPVRPRRHRRRLMFRPHRGPAPAGTALDAGGGPRVGISIPAGAGPPRRPVPEGRPLAADDRAPDRCRSPGEGSVRVTPRDSGHQIASHLAARHHVTLLAHAGPDDADKVETMRAVCQEVHTVTLDRPLGVPERLSQLTSLTSQLPYQVLRLRSPQMQRALDDLLA